MLNAMKELKLKSKLGLLKASAFQKRDPVMKTAVEALLKDKITACQQSSEFHEKYLPFAGVASS